MNPIDEMLQMEEDEYMLNLLLSDPTSRPETSAREKKEIVNRKRTEGHQRLFQDYFALNPTYNDRIFEHRFCMNKTLFANICEDLQHHNRFWILKADCCGQIGLSPHQKITCALRQLAYGMAADSTNEYLRIGETTAIRTLKQFVNDIIELYKDEFLRGPNKDEMITILKEYEERGFPGCLGSIDGMYWNWKNCPQAWAGQFRGKEKTTTMVLEAVASKSTQFWHCFFGSPGTLNDINILHRSPLFDELLAGTQAHKVHFTINGHEYNQVYYLADGVYPSWSTLVKTISNPQGDAERHYVMLQEAARKDIEHAFGVLQARWVIIKQPCRLWDMEDVKKIMTCCVILHNMIVETQMDTEDSFDSASISA